MKVNIRTDEGWKAFNTDRIYAEKSGKDVFGLVEYEDQALLCMRGEDGFDELMEILQEEDVGCTIETNTGAGQ